jgi:hypothetical protein
MTSLMLCAVVALAPPSAQRGARAPATRPTRDTIYVAVQPPPPTINVETPSQAPAVVLGILGLILVGLQV